MIAPYYSAGDVALYCAKVEDVSAQFTEPGICIFDAPYSEHVHSKSRSGARVEALHDGRGKRSKAAYSRKAEFGFASLSPELQAHLASECARLGTRWSLAFSDVESCHLWRAAFQNVGLEYVRTAAWRKLGGTPQYTGDRPAVGFEAITVAHPRGRKRWNGGGKHGVYIHTPADLGDLWYEHAIVLERGGSERLGCHEARIHETQKPKKLMLELVADFSEPAELVYDFTAGSCSTLVAAHALGRRAIGVEMREDVCERAARWLEAERKGTTYYHEREGVQGALFGGS